MCKNLIKAGYEMVVTTHNKETLKEMEAFGAKTVTCGREVAEEANVIITMLPILQRCVRWHLVKTELSKVLKKEVF